MNARELLELKLKALRDNLKQMQDNLHAQVGAIQVVEQLLSELEPEGAPTESAS